MKTITTLKPHRNRNALFTRRPPKTHLLIDLAAIRRERGVTIHQVSHETGLGAPMLCEIEHGVTPRLDTALRLATFIEQPVEKIWALNGKRKRRSA
jgi:DNA-binding XRE family transcriptional regulator